MKYFLQEIIKKNIIKENYNTLTLQELMNINITKRNKTKKSGIIQFRRIIKTNQVYLKIITYLGEKRLSSKKLIIVVSGPYLPDYYNVYK